MTSKIRFLGDGTGDVYVKCYFSQLSSTSSALLGPWKPYPGGIDHAFRPSLGPSRQNKYRPAATVQLLTKKRSIFLSFIQQRPQRTPLPVSRFVNIALIDYKPLNAALNSSATFA